MVSVALAADIVTVDKPDITSMVLAAGTAPASGLAVVHTADIADFKSCETGTFKILLDNTTEIGTGPPAASYACLGVYVAHAAPIVRTIKGAALRRSTNIRTYTGPSALMAHYGKGGCCFSGFTEPRTLEA